MTSQDELNIKEEPQLWTEDRTLAIASQDPLSIESKPQNFLTAGQILAGKYRVEAHIGSGGMSVVYKARDQVLGRDVAIKMLSASRVSDEKSVRRFHQEGTAVGRLNHQNIVSVFDVGLTESGEPFLVMDFASGKMLTDLVSFSGRCSASRALRLIDEVLDALIHAHEKGVVHRDLKPSNIIVSNPGESNETVKVFDFGIAKLMTGDEANNSELTQTGEIFGSPLYMSPEQCLGKALDGRSDIYSVGCILFELLVGHPPHQAETSVETIIKHVQETAPSLSEAFPGEKFPPGLEQLVEKALDKDPAKRFQSAREMKQAIAALNVESGTTQQSERPKAKLLGIFDIDPISIGFLAGIGSLVIVLLASLVWSNGSAPERSKPIRAELSSGMMRYAVDEAQLRTEKENKPISKEQTVYNFPGGIASLSYQDIADGEVGRLTNTPNVNKIRFDYCKISVSARILEYFSRMSARELDITGAKFDLEFLRALARMQNLRILLVNNLKPSLTEQQMEIICDTPNLTELFLAASLQSDDAFKPLANLKALKKLDISNCRFSQKALESIRKCSTLKELSMSQTNLSGRGVRMLSSLSQLSILDVSDNPLDDAALREFSSFPSLENLSLNECKISDAGLMRLIHVKKLHDLHLINCKQLTQRGLAAFRSAKPDCRVEH